MPKFKNNGGPIKIRIGESHKCYWKTIRTGDVVELSPENGKSLGLTEVSDISDRKCKPKVTEGQIGDKKVETKQIENDFLKELIKINGIGKKTAEDIIRIFPKREDLKNKIYNMETLPFREDICELLEVKYGNS